jgi:hypothetical protein
MRADGLLGDAGAVRELSGGERVAGHEVHEEIGARRVSNEGGDTDDARAFDHGSIVVEPYQPVYALTLLSSVEVPMQPLNAYLARHFFDRPQLAAASAVSREVLDGLLSRRLIPAPSYVVKDSQLCSAVFGTMSAPGAVHGQYFHRDMVVWVQLASECCARRPGERAYVMLKDRFTSNLRIALADLDRTVWRLRDCFRDDASLVADGVAARCDSMWQHFQDGTYGVCVARPLSEHAIARKEVLQEKLIALTDNGSRTQFSTQQRQAVDETITAYADACMPFSSLDYLRSSRKRLVDDFRKLNAHASARAI